MKIRHSVLALAAGAVMSTFAMGGALSAQTRFEWPAVNVDLSGYTTLEECLAATERVGDSIRRREAIWRDTMPFKMSEMHERQVSGAVATAHQCLKKFTPEKIALRDWPLLARLYLLAEEDTAVTTLVQYRLSAFNGTDQERASLRMAVLDTLVTIYLQRTKPARYAAAQILLDELIANKQFNAWRRSELLTSAMRVAQELDDDTKARWAAEQIIAVAGILKPGEDPMAFTRFQRAHHEALDYLSRRAQLDSLRKGTTGYVALKRTNWAKVTGSRSTPMNYRIGERAPALTGDFWFAPAGASTGSESSAGSVSAALSRPGKDRVNLLVFLTYQCRDGVPIHHQDAGRVTCWDTYAVIRRLAKHYPDLDITIVTRTMGFFWPLASVQPAEEATMLNQWWLGAHHLPAALTVTTTNAWRIEDPDRRRMNEEIENTIGYLFGRSGSIENRFGVLIDRDGIIIEAMALTRNNEPQFTRLLDVLGQR